MSTKVFMKKPLTFIQWLSQQCSLTEEQLKVVSLEYGEDSEDYIESKNLDYSIYLEGINTQGRNACT